MTANSRALKATSQEKELDTIDSWDMVSEYCSKFSPEHVVDISVSNVIKIFKFKNWPHEVEYSILIKDDLQVLSLPPFREMGIGQQLVLIYRFLYTK